MMAPPPPLPPLSGPPSAPPPPDNFMEPGTPSGRPPPSTPGSQYTSMTPMGLPPMVPQALGITRGIVHRGEPANVLAPPPGIPVPGGGLPTGIYFPPPPGAMAMSGGLLMPGMPPPPPAPPPPPREDETTFVRRIRLQYLERAAQAHAQILQDERSDTHWTTPAWVYTVTVLAPYIACTVSILLHIIIILAYATKFGKMQESNWHNSSIIGICIDLLVLELIRNAICTIVELRKFEIRRRLAGGDFLRSRIQGSRTMGKEALKLKRVGPKKPAIPVAPPMPPETKSAPPVPPPAKAPVTRPSRPNFLPPEVPTHPPPGVPGVRTATGADLPVAPPPPGVKAMPKLNIQAKGVSPINSARSGPGNAPLLPGKLDGMTPLGTPLGTPHQRGPLGAPGAGSLLPGKLSGPPGASLGSAPFGPPPAPLLPGGMPPSPSGSAVSGVTQSLTEKLKASRVGGVPPPPPPGGSSGLPPPIGKAGGLPRAGSSMSGSRPPTNRSGASGARTPPKPPTPPPAGTLQQTRASRRAQQQG